MKIRLKAPAGLDSTGIYGKDGKEMAVGFELELDDEPKGWAGRYDVISGSTKDKEPATGDGNATPKTAAEVIAMASDSSVQFMTFKAAAKELLGDKTPASKAEIVTALEELATQP